MKSLLCALAVLASAAPALAQTPADNARAMLEAFKHDPDEGRYWRAFDAAFPERVEDLADAFARGGGEVDAQTAKDVLRADLLRKTGTLIASAPDDALLAANRAGAETWRVRLAENSDECDPKRKPGAHFVEWSDAVRTAEAEVDAVEMEAAAAARRTPVHRQPPSKPELELYEEALRERMAAAGVPADVRVSDLSRADFCRSMVASHDAYERIPVDVAGRILAAFFLPHEPERP